MDYYNKYSYKAGSTGEVIFNTFIQPYGFEFVCNCTNKDYDLKYISTDDKSEWLFEVKYDSHPNNNVVIEFQSRGKPSGIQTTKSHVWVNIYNRTMEIWMIPTKDLYDMLINKKEYDDTVKGGDFNTSLLYRIKNRDKEDVRKKFKIFKY